MTKLYKFIFLLFVIHPNCYAQTVFEKTYGGNKNDEAKYIQKTPDGGYIITGYTNSTATLNNDIWVLKIDANGNIVSTTSFKYKYNDQGNCIQPTGDSGYVLAGKVGYDMSGDYNNNFAARLDSNGKKLKWNKNFFSAANANHSYSTVQVDADGNYVFGGSYAPPSFNTQGVMMKLNASTGDTLWETFASYIKDRWDFNINSSTKTSDGGFVFAGSSLLLNSGSKNNMEATLVKVDASGNEVWQKIYGTNYGNSSDLDYQFCNDVCPTYEGGLVAVGTSLYIANATLNPSNVYVIRTTSDGDSIWTKHRYIGYSCGGNSIKETPDGGYIITGYAEINQGDTDLLLLKLDLSGKREWYKTFGGTGYDVGNSIQLTSDGGYIIAGTSSSKGNGERDAYIIKTNANGELVNTGISKAEEQILFNIYPNPSTGNFVIAFQNNIKNEIKIYDINGRVIYNTSGKENTIEVDLPDTPNGIYLLSITQGDKYSQKEIVVQK